MENKVLENPSINNIESRDTNKSLISINSEIDQLNNIINSNKQKNNFKNKRKLIFLILIKIIVIILI